MSTQLCFARTAILGVFLWAQAAAAAAALPILSPPIAVSSKATASQLSFAGNGNVFLVVWTDTRNGQPDVYGARVDKSGKLLDGPDGFPIAATAAAEGQPEVAACGNTFLVVWGNGTRASNITKYFAARVSATEPTATAVLDGTPIPIAANNWTQGRGHTPASDGVDTFLFAWSDLRHTTINPYISEIYANRVSASTGQLLDGPGGFVIRPSDPAHYQGEVKRSHVAFGQTSLGPRFFVTWDDAFYGNTYPGEQYGRDTFAAFVSPAGNVIWPTGAALIPPGPPGSLGAFVLTRAASCQEEARAAFDGTNFLMVNDDERYNNCDTGDVRGQRVTPTGKILDGLSDTNFGLGGGFGDPGGIQIASDPPNAPGSYQHGPSPLWDGSAYSIVYRQQATSPETIRFKRLGSDGVLLDEMKSADLGFCIAAGTGMASLIGPGSFMAAYTSNSLPSAKIVTFQSKACGLITDGCGTTSDAGSCTGLGEVCGGGGTPNVCAAPHTTSIAYTGPAAAANGQPLIVSALLTDTNSLPGIPLANQMITIALGEQSCSATTDARGVGSCSIAVSQAYGPIELTANYDGITGQYFPSATTSSVLVFGYAPGGGSFVIADNNARVGTSVTFWGAQWWQTNLPTAGVAPASFKGFADAPAIPACGADFSSNPGNSSKPPASIPPYLAVIVSSSIGKSGSAISGNIVKMVIVRTGSGYAANPGHAGTGTVVATLCE
jgi:hypothetical protein